MKVAIIVVTYNAVKYLDDCFGSLRRIGKKGLNVEVFAVDNASTDGSADRIRADWPEVRLVENKENLGFAGGNNVGMQLAMDAGADYVYLLNQDTEIQPDFLTEAVKVAEADEKIGSVQSLLLLWQDKELINSTGNAIHFLGFGYCMNYRKPVIKWSHTGIGEIAYASGAGVLYRSAALRTAGLLDHELFLYHEDLDLGWRIRLAGFQNTLAPHSIVYHKYEFSKSIKKYYYMERNRYVVLLKNFRLWTLLVLSPWLFLTEGALFVAAVRGGWWKEKLKVYLYFLRPATWAHIVRERGRAALIRKVGDREIVRLFTATICFQDVTGPFTAFVANPLMTFTWAFLRLLIV